MSENKQIGSWKVNIGPSRDIPKETISSLENFLNSKWLEAIRKTCTEKNWWSIKNLGIPSPVIRIDISPLCFDADKEEVKKYIYEVETRPAAIGILLSLLLESKEESKIAVWKKLFADFDCKGFIQIESSIQDDSLAAKILGLPHSFHRTRNTFPPSSIGKGYYWIRSDNRDIIPAIEASSLVPIRTDGDKRYLVELKMAEIVTPENINWKEPFTIKPLMGSRMEAVEIFLPPSWEKKYKPGNSTKSRISKRLLENRDFIGQPFIPPQTEKIDGIKNYTIWRLFFGWSPDSYKSIGGLWNSRPNIRVHMTNDCALGLIV